MGRSRPLVRGGEPTQVKDARHPPPGRMQPEGPERERFYRDKDKEPKAKQPFHGFGQSKFETQEKRRRV